MQLVAEAALIPESEPQAEYIINRMELSSVAGQRTLPRKLSLKLKHMGLVQDKPRPLLLFKKQESVGALYVYLALKLTYPETNLSVDIESFCEDWKITESELAIAIAQLQKKGALEPKAAQLELELF